MLRLGVAALAAAAVIGAAPAQAAVEQESPWFPVLQNQLWWIGESNPNPPPQVEVLVFSPIFFQQLGWFANLNFEVCLLGATAQLGPYGTFTVSFSRGCA